MGYGLWGFKFNQSFDGGGHLLNWKAKKWLCPGREKPVHVNNKLVKNIHKQTNKTSNHFVSFHIICIFHNQPYSVVY